MLTMILIAVFIAALLWASVRSMAAVANVDAAPTYVPYTTKGPQPPESVATMASFLRPNDTNAYAAGDVVIDNVAGPRALAFPLCGRGGVVHSATLLMGETKTADFDLFLFESEPATGGADNVALGLVITDCVKCIGVFRFLDAAKVNMGTGMNLYRATSAGTDQAVPKMGYTIGTSETGGRLFGLLVTRSVWTPAALTKFTIRLGITRNVG